MSSSLDSFLLFISENRIFCQYCFLAGMAWTGFLWLFVDIVCWLIDKLCPRRR